MEHVSQLLRIALCMRRQIVEISRNRIANSVSSAACKLFFIINQSDFVGLRNA